MAHNRTTQYSAPYRRNNLLGLHQYAACDHFPSLGKWDRARSDDLYVVRGTTGRSQPVDIVIVGAISSDRSHLQPHGNFDPTYVPVEQLGKRAKLQFVLTCPEDDPDFAPDFLLAVGRLKAIQEEVAQSPERREHFIEGENLKFSFYLFTEKESPGSDTDEQCSEDNSGPEGEPRMSASPEPASGRTHEPHREIYEVAAPYRHAWAVTSENYHNNIMEVYGTNQVLIDYRLFDKHLVAGTTVAVTFNLKHYGIREPGSTKVVSDTYCAVVKTVSVLKAVERVRRGRTQAQPNKRRPLVQTQLPSRSTLRLAANTFAPVQQRVPNSSYSRPYGRRRGSAPGTRFSQDATSDPDTSSPSSALRIHSRADDQSSQGSSNGDMYKAAESLLKLVIPSLLSQVQGRPSLCIDTPPTVENAPDPLPLSPLTSYSSGEEDSIPPLVTPTSDIEAFEKVHSESDLPSQADIQDARTKTDDSSWVKVTRDDLAEDGNTALPGSKVQREADVASSIQSTPPVGRPPGRGRKRTNKKRDA